MFSLASLSYGQPILVGPNRPTSLDLTPSGDSLVVTLPEAKAIGIVDLARGLAVADTIRLTMTAGRRPDVVRVLMSGRVVLALTFDGSGFGGKVMEYNLLTKTQRDRDDVGINQTVTELTRLSRSGHRLRLLLIIDDSCCPLAGFVYNGLSDAWSLQIPTIDRFFPSVSGNFDGSRFLIANTMFSGTLGFIQTYLPAGYDNGPTALDADGATGFFSTTDGVMVVRLGDGVVLKTLPTDGTPVRIFALPNGKGIVVVTPTKLHVFGLPVTP